MRLSFHEIASMLRHLKVLIIFTRETLSLCGILFFLFCIFLVISLNAMILRALLSHG